MRTDQQVYVIERPVTDSEATEVIYIDPSWKNAIIVLKGYGEVEVTDPKDALAEMRAGLTVDLTVNGLPFTARSIYMQATKLIKALKPFEIVEEDEAESA